MLGESLRTTHLPKINKTDRERRCIHYRYYLLYLESASCDYNKNLKLLAERFFLLALGMIVGLVTLALAHPKS